MKQQFAIDITKNPTGAFTPQLAEGNFAAYVPERDDVIEIKLKAQDKEALLHYTKTGPLCE